MVEEKTDPGMSTTDNASLGLKDAQINRYLHPPGIKHNNASNAGMKTGFISYLCGNHTISASHNDFDSLQHCNKPKKLQLVVFN